MTHCLLCRSHSAVECADIRYNRFNPSRFDPCDCPCHETEWDEIDRENQEQEAFERHMREECGE